MNQSIILALNVINFWLIEVLDVPEFIVKDSGDEFVLGGDYCDDIVAVLVLFVFCYILSFFYVEVTSYFWEENGESNYHDTPGVVDNVPYAGACLLHPDELGAKIDWQSFEDSLTSHTVLVESPVKLEPVLTIRVVIDQALGAI